MDGAAGATAAHHRAPGEDRARVPAMPAAPAAPPAARVGSSASTPPPAASRAASSPWQIERECRRRRPRRRRTRADQCAPARAGRTAGGSGRIDAAPGRIERTMAERDAHQRREDRRRHVPPGRGGQAPLRREDRLQNVPPKQGGVRGRIAGGTYLPADEVRRHSGGGIASSTSLPNDEAAVGGSPAARPSV